MNARLPALLLLGLVGLAPLGCDSTGTLPDVSHVSLPAAVDAAHFSAQPSGQNALFPLVVGTAARYVGQTPEGEVVTLVEVTERQKPVQGVTTIIIRHRRWLDGALVQDTEGLYARDNAGNVWCFGEAVARYQNGKVVDRAGSWESGVDGARAGIMMWAQPRVGSIYYQEYHPGRAEDVSEVLSVNEAVAVAYGAFQGCLKTKTTTVLEPGAARYRYYCPGIGQVLEEHLAGGSTLELTEIITN